MYIDTDLLSLFRYVYVCWKCWVFKFICLKTQETVYGPFNFSRDEQITYSKTTIEADWLSFMLKP